MEKIKLKKPIQSFGNEVTELEFKREPNAGDCVKHGSVYSINSDGSMSPNPKVILAIAESCCLLSSGSLSYCALSDLTTITGVVMSFLGEKE